MSDQPSVPSRPLVRLVFVAGFIIFWVYAVVPAWLRESSIPSTGAVPAGNAAPVDNNAVAGWVGQTYFERTFLIAQTIHPASELGRAVSSAFPGNYYIVALGIDNSHSKTAVSIDPRATRMYTFSGESSCVLDPEPKSLASEPARKLLEEHHRACRLVAPGAIARTALFLIPANLDADRFYALEISINHKRHIIEGSMQSAEMKKDLQDALRIMTQQSNEPVLTIPPAATPESASSR